MKTSLLSSLFGLFLLFTSCSGNIKIENSKKVEQHPDSSSLMDQPLEDSIALGNSTNPNKTTASINDSTAITYVEGHVLLPVSYRIWEKDDAVSSVLNSSWLAIYQDGKHYHLGPLSYEISRGEDPCSGMPFESIDPKKPSIAYVHIPGLKASKLDTVALQENLIQPGKPFIFKWKNHEYKLAAFGRELNYERSKADEKYILNLYKDGQFVRTLVYQQEYSDTRTIIRLISDLDQDAEPDFIFDSPRDYEEHRILILLSGQAESYEESVAFDC